MRQRDMPDNWTTVEQTKDHVIIQRTEHPLGDTSIETGAEWGLFPNLDRGWVNPRISVRVRIADWSGDEFEPTVAWGGISGATPELARHQLTMLRFALQYVDAERRKRITAFTQRHETP